MATLPFQAGLKRVISINLVCGLVLVCSLSVTTAQENTSPEVTTTLTTATTLTPFNSSAITLQFIPTEGPFKVVQYQTENMTIVCQNRNEQTIIVKLSFNQVVSSTNTWIASGVEGTNWTVEGKSWVTTVIPVYGETVGKAGLTVTYYLPTDDVHPAMDWTSVITYDARHQIWCLRYTSVLQKVGIYGIVASLSLSMAGFACQLKSSSVKEFFSEPRTVLIHVVCQYIAMPVMSYLTTLIFSLPTVMAFGMVVTGCSPSGGPTNILTFLSGGDVGQSNVMTLLSVTLSIVTMPFWMYTLGEAMGQAMYPEPWVMNFPWMTLFILELIIIVPSFIGYTLNFHFPKIGRILTLVLCSVGEVLTLVFFIIIVYSNQWIFPLVVSWRYVVSGFILACFAHVISIVLCLCFALATETAITISIQTGLQSVTFAYFTLSAILPAPDGDIAFVMPVMYILTMFIPFVIALPIKYLISFGTTCRNPGKYLSENKHNSVTEIIDNKSTNSSTHVSEIKDLDGGLKRTESRSENPDVENGVNSKL